MVDAHHFEQQLLDSEETRTQVAFADVIVLNKTDLVTAGELDALERRVRGINALARIVRADSRERASVPIGSVLGIGGFDLQRALEYKPTFLEPEYAFEWGGAYELSAGIHCLELQSGPDPAMSFVLCEVLPEDTLDPSRAAERIFTWFSGLTEGIANGAEVKPGECAQILQLSSSGATHVKVSIPTGGKYWLFTQHFPAEFNMRLTTGGGSEVAAFLHKDFAAQHEHDQRVNSFSLESDRELDAAKFQTWIAAVLETQGTRLYRMKGFLNFRGSTDRIVIQGVHMVIDTSTLGAWKDRPRRTQLVFIGRELDRDALETGFEECLVYEFQ
jgi:G3E family GTPase